MRQKGRSRRRREDVRRRRFDRDLIRIFVGKRAFGFRPFLQSREKRPVMERGREWWRKGEDEGAERRPRGWGRKARGGSLVGKGDKNARWAKARERESGDQSGFTTLADGAILLHDAFYVLGKLRSFSSHCPFSSLPPLHIYIYIFFF